MVNINLKERFSFKNINFNNLFNSSILFKAGLISLIVVVIDYAVHFYYSSPIETPEYFQFKFIVAFLLTSIFIYNTFKKNIAEMALGALAFAGVFHIVYAFNADSVFFPIIRATEVFGIEGYLEVGAIFFGVHMIGYLIGFMLVKKYIKGGD